MGMPLPWIQAQQIYGCSPIRMGVREQFESGQEVKRFAKNEGMTSKNGEREKKRVRNSKPNASIS